MVVYNLYKSKSRQLLGKLRDIPYSNSTHSQSTENKDNEFGVVYGKIERR